MAVKTITWVTHRAEGFHAWPDAPVRRAYLRESHRHMFHYKVGVEVGVLEHDRGVEFHDLLDLVRTVTIGGDLGSNSCEMLALALAEAVQQWCIYTMQIGARTIHVEVSEDGECGATVVLGP